MSWTLSSAPAALPKAARCLRTPVPPWQEIKLLIRSLKRDNPNIEKSIFNSIHAVCLDTMPGYKTHGEEHSFLRTTEDDKNENPPSADDGTR